jgi:hypothetical protein
MLSLQRTPEVAMGTHFSHFSDVFKAAAEQKYANVAAKRHKQRFYVLIVGSDECAPALAIPRFF